MFKNDKQNKSKDNKKEFTPKLDMCDGSIQEGFTDDIVNHIYKKHRSTMQPTRREEPEE